MFDIIDQLASKLNVELVIVGESDYVNKYKRIASNRGIDDHVTWTGQIHASKLAPFYTLFDVCIMTSELESFGLSISESYLCETPCVAFDVGGMREQIKHAETGFLSPPDNIDIFTKYVRLLLENDLLRNQFGRRGRDYVQQHYTLDAAADEYQNIINSLI
jgi:glycosyltransferase involved in cell wall biosynthesis